MFLQSGTFGHKRPSRSIVILLLCCLFIFISSSLLAQPIESGNNRITLIWTASGDDNNWGQASYYDIRYSIEAVKIDTALWWQSAKQAVNLPVPSSAGQKDSCFINNLSVNQHYYFAIRTADEAFNWSEITRILEVPKFSCSDINGDGAFETNDLDYLLSYLYNNGPAPAQAAGDVNRSGTIDVADAMFMINYWLNSGPSPACD